MDLAVISTISMGNGRSVVALRFGDKTLLVGSTAESFTLLSEYREASPPGFTAGHSVADLLARDDADFDRELRFAERQLEKLDLA